MITAQKIINLVRRSLHDDNSGSYRWADSVLINYINDALHDLYNRRPEFWLNNNTLVLQDLLEALEADMTVNLLVSDRTLQGISGFVIYRALSEDDADTENLNRAITYRSQYEELIR